MNSSIDGEDHITWGVDEGFWIIREEVFEVFVMPYQGY
jgi:hypothetical protein